MDVWGRIYLDHWRGEVHPHVFVRDDGASNVFEDASAYFDAPRGDGEGALCADLHGRILDLGCGAGSYTLLLERQGAEVVAIDSSDGAIRVCRERGCRDARVMDFTELRLDPESFDFIICMGNTLGIDQTPQTLPEHMSELRALLKPGGHLLVTGHDPLATEVPNRLRYAAENQGRGRPPGLVRVRTQYRGESTDWWEFWLPTEEELARASARAGWSVESVIREDSSRAWLLRRR